MSAIASAAAMPLALALAPEVEAWSKEGWPGVTQTTHDLLSYWFERDEAAERFHECQQRAIETVIYCHEVLQEPTLFRLYSRLCPESLKASLALKEEAQSVPFEKYGLKMATGSGKTWVLIALMIWQYFNATRGERPGMYSSRFLLVAPGLEVLNRLKDAFQGTKDTKTGLRDVQRAEIQRSLFVPEDSHWRAALYLPFFISSDNSDNI